MKKLTEEQRAEIKRLSEDRKAKAEAAQEAHALYVQAVTAMAYQCGVPPRSDIVLDERTFEWCRVVGRRPDGEPALEPLGG